MAALGGCRRDPGAVGRDAGARAAPRPGPGAAAPAASNVRAADYVGPAACGECHPAEHARWASSLHAAMNRRADEPGAVVGDFSGVVVRHGDGEARFVRDAAGYAMDLRRGAQRRRYRVTRTIGRRALQEYVGVADDDPARVEVRLPFGWWPRGGGWRTQAAFDPWVVAPDRADGAPGDDPFAPVTEPWAARCPWCHSTYPFALRVLRAAGPLHLGHGPEQGLVAPPAGGAAVAAALAAEPGAARAAAGVLPVDAQVTPGISCESCHLGGRAHAAAAAAGDAHPATYLEPVAPARPAGGPAPRPFAVARRDPAVVDAVCTQCHAGPSPRLPDGSALRNSSEGLDLAAAPCATARCTDCHEPHRAAADVGAEAPRAIAACVGCHAHLASPAVAEAHGGHRGVAAAPTCLDCHMPRLVQGVDRVVRSHRISSPTDPAMLAVAAPNACNLCHLDRGIAWTARALARGWGVALRPTPAWRRAYGGDLEAPLGPRWLDGASPQIAIIAAAAYARAPLAAEALPRLRAHLADPRPWVRAWMRLAVDDATAGPSSSSSSSSSSSATAASSARR